MSSGYRNRGEATYVDFTPGNDNIEPATFSVGDPALVGERPAIAMTNRTAESSRATFLFYGGFDNVRVHAEAKVEFGQILYFAHTAKNGTHLTDVSHGNIRWGYSNQEMNAGTTEIKVVVGY